MEQRRLTLSARGGEVPLSPIRKLTPLADDARKRGIEIFHLNIGQPDIRTPRPVIEAYRGYNADVLAYTLSVNKFPSGKAELSKQTEFLKEIRFEAIKPEPKK